MQRRSFLFGVAGFSVGAAWVMGSDYVVAAFGERSNNQPVLTSRGSMDGFQDWVLTESDVDTLDELSALPSSDTLNLFNNVDIPGAGDYRAERVSGIDECVSACEGDDACNAFTFARISHPTADKRHMCWLKAESNPDRLIDDVFYISGIRP